MTDQCPNIVIRDSQEHSFDPIHGRVNDVPVDVFCNDGYVFNHDLLHQGGQIECTTKADDNNPQWYIKDDRLDTLCSKYNGSATPSCESVTYKPYDLLDVSEKEKKEIFGEEQFEFINRDIPVGCVLEGSQCVFKKDVKETSKHEKICEPLYCPAKPIPNSNKDGLNNNDILPGPIKDITKKGECINNDIKGAYEDKIIKYIQSPEDCLCHRHQSCGMCAGDDNCKWCGDKNSTGSTQAGCFSIYSKEPKCQEETTNLAGRATCINSSTNEVYPEWNKLEWDAQTEQKCKEDKGCFLYNYDEKQLNGEPIPLLGENIGIITSDKIEDISMDNILLQTYKEISNKPSPLITDDDFKNFRNDRKELYGVNYEKEICDSFNNTYTNNENNDHINTEGCYYENMLVQTQGYGDPAPFGLTNKNTSNNISIEPYYCEPLTSNDNTCWGEPYQSCATPSCKWTKNHLDNNIIKFSDEGNIMELSCDKCKLDGTQFTYDSEASPTKWYVKSNKDEKYITINGPSESSDSSDNKYSFDKASWPSAKYKIKYYDPSNSLINNKSLAPDIFEFVETEYCGDECKETNTNRKYTYYDVSCGNPSEKISLEPERNYKRKSIKKGHFNNKECTNINDTGFKYNNEGGYTYPTSISTLSTIKKSYGICVDNINMQLKGLDCSTINNRYMIDNVEYNTSNYSYLCNSNNGKISAKELCEITDGHTWMYKTDDEEWGCFNTEGTTPTPTEICGFYDYNIDDNKQFKCLIEVPTTEMNSSEPSQYCTSYYNKSWSGPTGSDILVSNINTNTVSKLMSDIKFNVNTNKKDVCDKNYEGCNKGTGNPYTKDLVNSYGENDCNEVWRTNYENIYEYNSTNHCPNNDININDKNLEWMGGDIYKDDNGNWGTTCSSSILSSCQVVCDEKWGGGGEFVCDYNNDAEEICSKIDMISDPSSKENNCGQYPLCEYNGNSCQYTPPPTTDIFSNKGQTEWIGPECYLLNNDAFAQGVYNYPSLNSKFPPLARLIVFFFIIILISFILYKLDVFKKLLIKIKNIIVGIRVDGNEIKSGLPKSFINTLSKYYKSFKYSLKNFNSKKITIYVVSIVLLAMFITVMGRIYDSIKSAISIISDKFINIDIRF